MIDKLPIKGGSQGQYLGGILLFFIVFIPGMKTLPPIISGRIGYRPVDKNAGNDSNLLIVFYVQIVPDDFVMQLHRF
ncbi:Uncharacterised protein [Klebsiella pneumoniae]|nr:Uncharacterised protein [Klebsiella pneumoniae]SVR10869.1 Uncharacterised protein [Klebsiella pneumoniae]SVU49530.1 Uncharacterised protein [Klebsiella pneumoniae]SVV15900.1 Uncharacterised protein [Klebsiella pneumoniae]SVV21864.1 Uncharacterised protein [Klebsiella pneumoniae]